MTKRLVLAVFAAVAYLSAAAAPARASELGGLRLPDFSKRLKFLPSSQFEEGALSFLPKGQNSDEPWEIPIVASQWATSAVISCLGVWFFNASAAADAATYKSQDHQRSRFIWWGFAQFLTQPLVSSLGVYLVGNLSQQFDVELGIPLAANYLAELILIALRIGISFGGASGEGVAEGAAAIADAIGIYGIIDYILHATVVAMTVTFFSVRSRGPKQLDYGSRELLMPKFAARSIVDLHEEGRNVAPAPVQATLSLLDARF